MKGTSWFSKYFSYVVIIIAFCIPLLFVLFSYITLQIYYENYLPELLAGFLGVFLGLYLETERRRRKDKFRAQDLAMLLKDEIEEIKERADVGKGNYLETQTWQSLIQSGDIAFLDIEFQKHLFRYYSQVNAHNIDMSAARSASIQARISTLTEEVGESIANLSSKGIHDKEKKIIELTNDILSLSFWHSRDAHT